jgi:hypothetical protein
MTSKVLVRKVTTEFVPTGYLNDLREAIGEQAYMTSFVRSEYGPGTGFFGVDNTGSVDADDVLIRAAEFRLPVCAQ